MLWETVSRTRLVFKEDFVSLISFAKSVDGKSDLNSRKRAKDAKKFEI